MDRTEQYREIVKRIIEEYAAYPASSVGDVEAEAILDDQRHHYELIYAGWEGQRRIHGSVLHVDIRDGKIWIQHDGTEAGIANELLDCLPPRQFVRTETRWAERVVGLDGAGNLAFGLSAAALGQVLPDAPPGSVLEHSPVQEALGSELGARIAAEGGAALLIDYGRGVPGFGDTLQALKRHVKEDPLASPGEADLTVHADFPAVLRLWQIGVSDNGGGPGGRGHRPHPEPGRVPGAAGDRRAGRSPDRRAPRPQRGDRTAAGTAGVARPDGRAVQGCLHPHPGPGPARLRDLR